MAGFAFGPNPRNRFINNFLNPGQIKGQVDFTPGIWFSLGLIVIGGIMSWVGVMIASAILTGIDMAVEGLGQLIVMPIGAIFGFIPVFMYGAWLGAQVKGGF